MPNIFREERLNKLNNVDCYYFFEYIPNNINSTSTNNSDDNTTVTYMSERSKLLMETKDIFKKYANEEIIDNEILSVLRENIIRFCNLFKYLFNNIEFTMCAIPNSKKSDLNKDSLCSFLVKTIIKDRYSNIIDGTDCVIRKKDIKPAHKSQKKKKERIKDNEDSITIKNLHKIKNKSIVILDDIYTTGATMTVVKEKLLKLGAKEVICIALAKTISKKNLKPLFIFDFDNTICDTGFCEQYRRKADWDAVNDAIDKMKLDKNGKLLVEFINEISKKYKVNIVSKANNIYLNKIMNKIGLKRSKIDVYANKELREHNTFFNNIYDKYDKGITFLQAIAYNNIWDRMVYVFGDSNYDKNPADRYKLKYIQCNWYVKNKNISHRYVYDDINKFVNEIFKEKILTPMYQYISENLSNVYDDIDNNKDNRTLVKIICPISDQTIDSIKENNNE